MPAPSAIDPPDPRTAADPAEYIERLKALRFWAGEPSLRRLRQLAGTTLDARGNRIDALPTSTISQVLRRARLPRMEFVRAYVTACLAARGFGAEATAEQLARWHDAWLAVQSDDPPPLRSASTPPPEAPTADLKPRQLPADLSTFTGREAELAELVALATGADGAVAPATVLISAIDGMAGVGKTAFAVHAAHRLAGHYPDGQLFIDLHGYTEGLPPVDPADALDRLLLALGVPGERIPEPVEDRAALYRSRLAGQRMLIVLDNAATEQQVAPLLPGAPGCLVLITSRRRLLGLDGTHPISLAVLSKPDAIRLLARTAGQERIAAEPPEAADQLVELCGRLPLAIRIAAARLRSHPSWRIEHLVGRLADQQHRLAELDAGDRSVTAALDLSYQQLTGDEQRAYRLLGGHPGPEADRYAAAALINTTLPHTQRLLDRLLEVYLLQEPAPGRYRFHDLVRAHAANIRRDHPDPRLTAGLDRLLDYYRHTVALAVDAAYPYERDHRPRVPPARTPVPDVSDPARARSWLATELSNLLAAASYAAAHDRPAHLLHFSALLRRHLRTCGRYHDAAALHQQALVTARATGRPAAEIAALIGLGHIHRLQGRYDQAGDHFEQALRIAGSTGHRGGELDARIGLGHVDWLQGRYGQAGGQFEQAVRVARKIGHRSGELEALIGIGHIGWHQARYESATDHYHQALRIAREIGHRTGELDALAGLGQIYRQQGRYRQAIDQFQQALRIARDTGNRNGELNALVGLGHLHRWQGQYPQAIESCQRALRIARDAGHRLGELVALTGLGQAHRLQHRYGPATVHYRQLLELARAGGDRNFEFEAAQGLGRIQYATGELESAVTHHHRALALAGELGQPVDQARAHDGLAHAHHGLDHPELAREHWQRALEILTRLGVERTDDQEASTAAIRGQLARLDQRRVLDRAGSGKPWR